MGYSGRVTNGVIVLDEAVRLPEGARVNVELTQVGATSGEGNEPPREEHATFVSRLRRRQAQRRMKGPNAEEIVEYLRREHDAWGD